jgi:hypothetical protein
MGQRRKKDFELFKSFGVESHPGKRQRKMKSLFKEVDGHEMAQLISEGHILQRVDFWEGRYYILYSEEKFTPEKMRLLMASEQARGKMVP